jgi:IS1 family transposase
MTTDGFRPYKNTIKNAFGDRVDFAQFYKERNMLNADKKALKFNRKLKDSQHLFVVRSGEPNQSLITTNHIERLNLSLRTFNRRFNRKTICFSKNEECLAYSVYLFAAHYNFCRVHGTHGQTPAMAAGLTNRKWSIEDLLNPANFL